VSLMPRDDRPVKTSTGMKQVSKNVSRSKKARGNGEDVTDASGASSATEVLTSSRVPRLLVRYRGEILPVLMKEFGYLVPLQAPQLKKVVINVGMGEALQNPNAMETVTRQLADISGQSPVVTKAKKSIAGFKIRAGMAIGVMVTLRGKRMYDFVDRILNAALPRIRDFRGVPRNSFDGQGNYSLGIREQVIFPEIDYNRIDRIRGLQVSFVTSAKSDLEAFRLLELLGMPFARAQDRG